MNSSDSDTVRTYLHAFLRIGHLSIWDFPKYKIFMISGKFVADICITDMDLASTIFPSRDLSWFKHLWISNNSYN